MQRFANHHARLGRRRRVLQAPHARDDVAVARQRTRDEVKAVGRAPRVGARALDREGAGGGVERGIAGEADVADVLVRPARRQRTRCRRRGRRRRRTRRHDHVAVGGLRRRGRIQARAAQADEDVGRHRDRVAADVGPGDPVHGLITGEGVAAAIEAQPTGRHDAGGAQRRERRSSRRPPTLEGQRLPRRQEHVSVGRSGGHRLANHHAAARPDVRVLDARDPRDDRAVAGERLIGQIHPVSGAPDVASVADHGEGARGAVVARRAVDRHGADVTALPRARQRRRGGAGSAAHRAGEDRRIVRQRARCGAHVSIRAQHNLIDHRAVGPLLDADGVRSGRGEVDVSADVAVAVVRPAPAAERPR